MALRPTIALWVLVQRARERLQRSKLRGRSTAKREMGSVGFRLASQRTLTERALECRQPEQSHSGIVLTFAALVALTLARVATAKGTSPNDMFVGSVQRGTRAYRNVQGTVYMTLSLGAHGRPGRFRLRFEGTRCPDETSCLALSGVVRGNATPRRGVPDSEGLLGLRGYGRVSLLGPVGLRGVIQGTDFVETGQEHMSFVIAGRRGTLLVRAVSPSVPGFTSP